MQKILIGGLAVATLALSILCAFQWNQLRSARHRVQELEVTRQAEAKGREEQLARANELKNKSDRLEKQLEQFVTLTTNLRSNAARQSSNLTALTGQLQASRQDEPEENRESPDGKGGLFGAGMSKMLAKMMEDPDMRQMMRSQQKIAVNMMYSGLFKELNLSPEEKEKLMSILTDAQMRQIDNAQALFGEKTAASPEDSAKTFEEATKQMEAEIKGLLGEERYAQYQDYKTNLSERMELDQIKNHLEAQQLPLDAQQTAQLLELMKEVKAQDPPAIPTGDIEGPGKGFPTAENLDRQMDWMDEHNRRVLERAREFLTPAQLEQFGQFQEQQAAMQKLGLKMAREMFDRAKTDAPEKAK